jgi:SAM-dependent methyltransferase
MPSGSKRAQQSIVRAARHNAFLSALIGSVARSRANRIAPLFTPWLDRSGCVLDIGTGTGHLTETLNGFARRIIRSDIVDLSFVGKLDCLADGTCLPFWSAAFDAVLLVTVLHHIRASAQAAVLREGFRVLRPQGRLILLEDTFRSVLERRAVALFDSALSAEFLGHPHSNRTLEQWVDLLAVTGFRLLLRHERVYWYGIIPIRHSLMVAEKP